MTRTMETLDLAPFEHPARGIVSVPGSKSINNRALLLAALAHGTSTLTSALDSDDTRIFASCLRALGFDVTHDRDAETFTVTGCEGVLPNQPADLFVGNAGTAARFLLAMCALGSAPVRFDGVEAMRKRPMGDLLALLQAQGAIVTYEGEVGHFPLTLTGAGLPGGSLQIDPQKSSQQVSAALMVAPFAAVDTTIELIGPVVSEPYIIMTINMMRDWGVEVTWDEPGKLTVKCGQGYKAKSRYIVEPDASSASYFFAAAAITGGEVTVRDLFYASAQGDTLFVDALAGMGCTVEETDIGLKVTGPVVLGGLEIDMNAISDTAPTLAAIAANASDPVVITGVEHMRWKETDRVAAMATQLRAMGASIEERQDGLVIQPSPLSHTRVATYDDHRMAMSLAIAGIGNQGVEIEDAGCTSKTFPTFFDVLADLRSQSAT